MAEVGTLLVRLKADLSEFSKDMENFDKRMKSVGDRMKDVGGRLTAGLTLPIAGVGIAAGKMSIDFESAFAGVRKTVDASESQFAELRQGIRDMAKEIPASTTEIAGIAEAAGQLGIQTENILSFTRVMADLGVATNLSGEQAATALARLANITQMSQQDFDRLGSTIVALGNNLATTEAEIVEMGLRIAGAGHQIGLTEAQILALAGALSSVGIEAQAGGSAISRVMIEVANQVASSGENLAMFAEVAGMTATEFQRAFREDAAGAIVTFVEGLARMSTEGENVFAVLDELGLAEIRVRDALLRAAGAGDLMRQSLELATTAWEENTALVQEAEQRYATTESRLTLLWNRIKDVGITLGDVLVPAFMSAIEAAEPLIKAVERAAQWFSNLDPSIQTVIIAIAGLVAAIGPLLVVLGMAVSGAGAAAGALSFLLSPIGLVIAAVAGLTTAWLIWGDDIKRVIGDVVNRVSAFFTDLKDGVLRSWEAITNGIKGFVNSIISFINRLIDAWNRLEFRVPSINIPFVGEFGGFTIGLPKLPRIPALASGGIVTRPTLAMIGEAGPEAVIPLNRGAAAAGIGPITVNVYGSVGVEDIAERLIYELRLRTPIR